MDYETKKVFLVNIAVLLVGAAAVWITVKFLIGYLLPFVIGVVLAAAVKRPARYLAGKSKIGAGVWSVSLVVLLYLICASLLALAVWQAVSQAGRLTEVLPGYIEKFDSFTDNLGKWFAARCNRLPDKTGAAILSAFDSTVDRAVKFASGFLTDGAAAIAGKLPSVLFSAVITVVASCYIALDSEHLIRFAKDLLPKRICERIIRIRDIFRDNIFKYILGYILLSLIAFAELLIGFFLLRIRYAVLLAALTAFVDLLPVFGTGTVLIPWAVIDIISGNRSQAIGLLVIYAVISVVRYFAEPHIVGKRVGVDPLITLIAMVVGLRIGGLAGLLILPIACVVTIQYYKRQIAEENNIPPSA